MKRKSSWLSQGPRAPAALRRLQLQASRAANVWDAIIVGGGPAGLSAALLLGRCRRRVLLFDDGRGRNACARHSHGYWTRDGASPEVLRRIGRRQLTPYDVRLVDQTVARVVRRGVLFEVVTAAGAGHRARRLLLATGIRDPLPAVAGLEACYGRSVFQCPYCDGWEVRERALAVHGRGQGAVDLALALTSWSAQVVLCTDGWVDVDADQRAVLAAHGIALETERVARLEARRGWLQRIRFASGRAIARDALFFYAATEQRSPLVAQVCARFDRKGAARTGCSEEADAPGVFVAGDASEDANFLVVAAAEGVKAACAIHKSLREEESRLRCAEHDAGRGRRGRTVPRVASGPSDDDETATHRSKRASRRLRASATNASP